MPSVPWLRPSQGSLQFDTFAFNYWQYVDILTFWGGSASEGLILAPNPGVIDAAHRSTSGRITAAK